MRAAVVCAALVVAGCAASDPTANRAPAPGGDYPAGPYGYTVGSVIADLGFIGKRAETPTDYTPLPLLPMSLGALRAGGARLILIDGVARWCSFCIEDQPALQQLLAAYAPRGVAAIEVLAEGGIGISATEDDINRWAAANSLSGPIALDPERQLAQYADVDVFPLYMVVRASTMTIEYMATGGMARAPLGPLFDMLLGP